MAQNLPFLLHLENPLALEAYLQKQGWLLSGEKILRLEKPGVGNMNCVARATTNERAFIVKQARHWVEKYPSIAAPAERALVEATFYQTVQRAVFFQQTMPRLLHFDPENYLLVLEDLGESADYLHLYQSAADIGQSSQTLSESEAAQLGEYLCQLHRLELPDEERTAFPHNLALRRLNHEHIFNFPFRNDTGFDLDTVQPGLQAIAQPFRQDNRLKKRVEELGKIYLSPGKTLLHGDYYPGSWLSKGLLSERVSSGVRIIDPEFCFMGCAEFDFGVMAAHAEMAYLSHESRLKLVSAYEPPFGFNHALAEAFKGTEILRRLIGLAQLPLQRSLKEKQALLELGRALIIES